MACTHTNTEDDGTAAGGFLRAVCGSRYKVSPDLAVGGRASPSLVCTPVRILHARQGAMGNAGMQLRAARAGFDPHLCMGAACGQRSGRWKRYRSSGCKTSRIARLFSPRWLRSPSYPAHPLPFAPGVLQLLVILGASANVRRAHLCLLIRSFLSWRARAPMRAHLLTFSLRRRIVRCLPVSGLRAVACSPSAMSFLR